MKREIILAMITDASFADVGAMMDLLEEAMNNTSTIEFKVNSRPLSDNHEVLADAEPTPDKYKAQVASMAKAREAKAKQHAARQAVPEERGRKKRVWTSLKDKYRDERLVQLPNRSIDLMRTLRNLNLTTEQLMAMRTKRGTLEHAVKNGMVARRGWATRKRTDLAALHSRLRLSQKDTPPAETPEKEE